MPPNSAVSALCTSASASARQIKLSTPCGLSRCAALAIQRGNRPGAAACARRRRGSGDRFCRVASWNGGFISTRSALPDAIPAAASASTSSASQASTFTRLSNLLSRILSAASAQRAASISTSVTLRPATRAASARPAAPTPAPRSTACSLARPPVAAASKIASWPTRWPRSGWRKRSLPPSTASSLVSRTSVRIGTQLLAEPGVLQDLPRRTLVPFGYQNPPRQYAERAFQHAHVLVEHHGTNAGALEQGHHCRDQNHVIGANEFAQFALFLLPRRQRFYKALFYVVWHPRRQWNLENLCPLYPVFWRRSEARIAHSRSSGWSRSIGAANCCHLSGHAGFVPGCRFLVPVLAYCRHGFLGRLQPRFCSMSRYRRSSSIIPAIG